MLRNLTEEETKIWEIVISLKEIDKKILSNRFELKHKLQESVFEDIKSDLVQLDQKLSQTIIDKIFNYAITKFVQSSEILEPIFADKQIPPKAIVPIDGKKVFLRYGDFFETTPEIAFQNSSFLYDGFIHDFSHLVTSQINRANGSFHNPNNYKNNDTYISDLGEEYEVYLSSSTDEKFLNCNNIWDMGNHLFEKYYAENIETDLIIFKIAKELSENLSSKIISDSALAVISLHSYYEIGTQQVEDMIFTRFRENNPTTILKRIENLESNSVSIRKNKIKILCLRSANNLALCYYLKRYRVKNPSSQTAKLSLDLIQDKIKPQQLLHYLKNSTN